MPRVYFDNAATTPMNEVALTAFVEQSRVLGNPSSLHAFGRESRRDLESARERLATLIGSHPSEVIFTGSGTEANNLALKGIYWHRNNENPARKIIAISAFEHHAVLDPALWLGEEEGAEVVLIPVTHEGFVDLDFLRNLIATRGDEIALISVMHANNEVGTIQPIREIAMMANEKSIPVHVDAIQSLGKIPLSFSDLGIFAMTISAHKVGGPVGVGALILRKGVDITPLIHGGGQEREIRSGTLNSAAIVAFVSAVEIADRNRERNHAYLSQLRRNFYEIVKRNVPDVWINGSLEGDQLPTIINIGFPDTESDSLLLLFDSEGIACSTGSACSAGVQQASHVLLAMGLSEERARSCLRFSFGPQNTQQELEYFETRIARVIERAQSAYRRQR